jgi:hypothetical protein
MFDHLTGNSRGNVDDDSAASATVNDGLHADSPKEGCGDD